MDAEDDLIPEPDAKGAINLSNRAWVNLDPYLWTLSEKLVKLDMSYNHLTEIPSQIGEMIMLREIVASFNKIVRIPREIGRLKRLKRLLLNSNRLKKLPEEIGQLEQLEELILSENSIESLPDNLSRMSSLRILKLSNNKLTNLPYEIAELPTIEVIDCGNNPKMNDLPLKWQGDTDSILFTCKLHRGYKVQLNEVKNSNEEMAKHSRFIEQENLVMKEKLVDLQTSIDELRLNIPKKVLEQMEKQKEKEMHDNEGVDGDKNGKGGCSIS